MVHPSHVRRTIQMAVYERDSSEHQHMQQHPVTTRLKWTEGTSAILFRREKAGPF